MVLDSGLLVSGGHEQGSKTEDSGHCNGMDSFEKQFPENSGLY